MRQRLVKGILTVGVLTWTFVTIVSCTRTPSQERAHALLAGEYELFMGSDCRSPDVLHDRLTLSPDRRLSQQISYRNGQVYTSATGRWQYMPPNSVSLDMIKDSTGIMSSGNRPGDTIGAGLIVEFSNPPVILLDPDKSCFYEKKKQ